MARTLKSHTTTKDDRQEGTTPISLNKNGKLISGEGHWRVLKRAVSGMLPKNKLRRKRLDRLQVFDDTNTGGLLKNAIKRYDNVVVPSMIPVPEDLPSHLIPSTSVKMQDDTPPLGSLSGLKPSYRYKPKVKKVKEKKKKTPPGEMKIFNEEGKEVGIAHWKNKKASKAESIELVEEMST
jgi:hypothetical protein